MLRVTASSNAFLGKFCFFAHRLHFRRAAFSSQLKSKVGNILIKDAALLINLNSDGTPMDSRSRTHPSHSQTSLLLTSSLFSSDVYSCRGDVSMSGGTGLSMTKNFLLQVRMRTM